MANKHKILIAVIVMMSIAVLYGAFKSIANEYIGILSKIPNNLGNFDHYIGVLERLRDEKFSGPIQNEKDALELERLEMEIHYARIAKKALRVASSKGLLNN